MLWLQYLVEVLCILRDACEGPAWSLRGACVGPAWGLHGACVGLAWGLRGACVGLAWGLREACVVRSASCVCSLLLCHMLFSQCVIS